MTWSFIAPEEPPRDLQLELVLNNGALHSRWRWDERAGEWCSPGSFCSSWASIVQRCMTLGGELRVTPIVDPIDVGTAAMVAKQIESHITLPAFVKESAQYDRVTEGGKEEWRGVFRAGLEAYLAAERGA